MASPEFGLTNGIVARRRTTTHWQRTRHVRKTYPQVRLEPIKSSCAMRSISAAYLPASFYGWR
jgi:hypothetical protein